MIFYIQTLIDKLPTSNKFTEYLRKRKIDWKKCHQPQNLIKEVDQTWTLKGNLSQLSANIKKLQTFSMLMIRPAIWDYCNKTN